MPMTNQYKTVISISGGKTSAYLAANYHSDELVFSLVRTSDKHCMFKDKQIAKIVEDKISTDFIGTLEDDTIIYTILDLEQYLGKKIHWVTGITFDELVLGKFGGRLPSILRRYCTVELKIRPIFHWWHSHFNRKPIFMGLGYRANEGNRVKKVYSQLDENGFQTFKASFNKHKNGRHKGLNKWEYIKWRKPIFPLFMDGIEKFDIEKYWKNKPVRFAKYNNCVGCFHRKASLLKYMSEIAPKKFDWFVSMEKIGKGNWKEFVSYNKIKSMSFTMNLFESNLEDECGSGFCGY